MLHKNGNNIVVGVSERGLKANLDFIMSHGYDIEIQTFCHPAAVEGDWKKKIKEFRGILADFRGKIHLHGAIFDLNPISEDIKVVELTKRRYFQSLKIAQELEAKIVVFHSQYNCLRRDRYFMDRWVNAHLAFWPEIVEEAAKKNIVIALENSWERTPLLIKELVTRISSPNFKICLDTGHANVFSNISIEEWAKCFAKELYYVHIHDNNGEIDEHLAAGEGSIKFDEFFATLKKLGVSPKFNIEVDTMEGIRKSIDYIEKRFDL